MEKAAHLVDKRNNKMICMTLISLFHDKKKSHDLRRTIRAVFASGTVVAAIFPTLAFAQVSASCQKFVGIWNISDYRTVIRADGRGTFSDGGAFTWTCAGNVWIYTMVDGLMPGPWKMTLSQDGKRMNGPGAMGEPMVGVRLSPAPQTAGKTAPAHASPNASRLATASADFAEKLLMIPVPDSSRGIYKLDREYDFNVLDAVYYDAATNQISLTGHRDGRFKGSRIPYLQHLATLLETPKPSFTLTVTPASKKKVDTLFNTLNKQQGRQMTAELTAIMDKYDAVSSVGRYMLPALGVYPTADNKAPGYFGVETRLSGAPIVTRVALGSPAAQVGLAGGNQIIRFNGERVFTPGQLSKLVRFAGAGSSVEVVYRDGQQIISKDVTLTADYNADPWAGFNRFDFLAGFYRAEGRKDAAHIVDAIGQAMDKDSDNYATMMNLFTALDLGNEANALRRAGRSNGPGANEVGISFGRMVSQRLDEIFEFSGHPVVAAYNANLRRKRGWEDAVGASFDQWRESMKPKLGDMIDHAFERPGGVQIAPELVEGLFHVHAEMTPEYRGVASNSLLARAMLAGDYLAKRLINRPDIRFKIPRYQTEYEFNRSHPEFDKAEFDGHLWISVAQMDAAQSAAGDTLEFQKVKMRFNIREYDKNHRDLPSKPGGYEELLTSLYDDFAQEYPTLHELQEAAKLSAAAQWLRAKSPSIKLSTQGVTAWHGPSKLPGLLYVYLNRRGADLIPTLISVGGVLLDPFPQWHGPKNPDDADNSATVDLRGTRAGGPMPRGAALVPVDAKVVDLRTPAGGYLVTPPPYDDAAGWVVHVDASHGGQQSVSLMLDRIRKGVTRDRRVSSETCRALNDQIADLEEGRIPAELSSQVYNKFDPNLAAAKTPNGLKLISDFKSNPDKNYDAMKQLFPGVELAEIQKLIDPENTDYRAAIYQDEKTGKIFVAFRGTQSAEDAGIDYDHGIGNKVSYYDKATRLAELLKQSPYVQQHGIEFVGHSLGGGLAAAASLAACGPDPSPAPPRRWQCSADTFNAVGVHPTTVVGKDLRAAQGYIKSYVVENEPLNTAQDHRAMTAAGIAVATLAIKAPGILNDPISTVKSATWAPRQVAMNDALPPSLGRRTTLPVWKGGPPPLQRHSISTVIDALGDRITKLKSEYANDCAARRPTEVPVPRPEASGAWKKPSR
jgi:PDZ domain